MRTAVVVMIALGIVAWRFLRGWREYQEYDAADWARAHTHYLNEKGTQ